MALKKLLIQLQGVADMANFDYEKILFCLEQKNLLMKDILNLTRRIEVKAAQEEVVLDAPLAERQNRIDRLIKCDKLISDEMASIDNESKAHLRDLLAGKAEVAADENETKMVELVSGTKSYLSRTLEIDKSAMAILQQKREEARIALVEINNEKASN